MIASFQSLARNRIYWLALILLCVTLEAVALYYQYALDEWPCVLCIHIRIYILGIILLACLGLMLGQRRWPAPALHLVNSALMLGLVERSWQTLGVERGWVFGDCNMSAGLPAWFELDKWFPLMFEVQTACGYTPILAFKVSMAEALLVISSLLLVLSLGLLLASVFATRHKHDITS